MRKTILVLFIALFFGNTSYANAPLKSEDFSLEDVAFSNYTTTHVKMLAEFFNGSESFIKSAQFGIYLYNYSDELIDIQYIAIANLAPNESRPIKLFFECPSKNDINDVKVKFITILE